MLSDSEESPGHYEVQIWHQERWTKPLHIVRRWTHIHHVCLCFHRQWDGTGHETDIFLAHTMLLLSSEHGVLLLVPWSVCHVEEYHPEIWLQVLRVLCSHLKVGMFEAASEQSHLLHLWHLQLSLVCHQQLLLVWSLIINVFPVLLESLEDLKTRTRGSEYTGKNEF